LNFCHPDDLGESAIRTETNNKINKKNVLSWASPCVVAVVMAVRKQVCFHPPRQQRRHFVLTKLNKKSSTAFRKKCTSCSIKSHPGGMVLVESFQISVFSAIWTIFTQHWERWWG